MAYTNITSELREIVSKSSLPDTKRRKSKAPKRGHEEETQRLINKEFILEGYSILKHINNLTRMLASIRRAYLNIDASSSSFVRQAPRAFELGEEGTEHSWSAIRYLTNEERDQIDLQAKVILSKCMDRVKQMEALNKQRAELASNETNVLMRFLPSRLKHDSSSAAAANLAAHHSSITYYLNRRLAQASQHQKEMQEERIRRQTERTRTLGSSATLEGLDFGVGGVGGTGPGSSPATIAPPPTMASSSSTRSWLGDAASNLAASILLPSGSHRSDSVVQQNVPQAQNADELEDDDYDVDDIELSASQIQQFESENANILRSVQDTLASVQQAESRLMDISALQMELVSHLTQQAEIADQLYEDAIATTETVDRGNVQLKEAKRRAKDSRLYILFFLIGASFSLLFLHYY